MTWTPIAAWLIAHGLEFAAVVTTIIGIWLTTKRLLICWPIILLADFLYLVVFYQSGLFSDTLLQVFFIAFTLMAGGTGGAACAPTAKCAWNRSACGPASWLLLWALSAA